MSTADLLERWRDASRAAALAESLAKLALETADRADHDAEVASELAEMAESTAQHATRAAAAARAAADRAIEVARKNRSERLPDADEAVVTTRHDEESARDEYHAAEREARERYARADQTRESWEQSGEPETQPNQNRDATDLRSR